MRVERAPSGRAGSAFRAAAFLCALALVARAAPGGDEALEGARAKLRANDKWARAEAVEELAHLGGEEAWGLVIEALADPKGEVADAAQLALAALHEPKALEALAGEAGLRSKDALVRARVAELLGRLANPAPAKGLERALHDGEPEVRRMAAWSLERLARGGKLDEKARADVAGDLAQLARSERDGLARARALAALCEITPGPATAALDAAWRERDPLVRAAVAGLAWEHLPSEVALVRLTALSADPVLAVRRAALEALGASGARAGVAQLVARLPLESEERLVLRDVELLQALSGMKYKRDPRPWNDWLRALPADWSPGQVRAPAEDDPATHTRAALAGLPIVSEHVAILIDLSGSIWNVRPDGRTRKEIVDQKLREALEALSSETRFNLIPYTGVPHPWKKELVPATPARVREAAGWFEACKENGSGNLWDAALLALSDPEVDTLVVLFDGAPTGGVHHRLELLVPLLLERNLARRAVFDFVLVDGTKKLERNWGALAAGTGGRLLAVTL